ncbi:hypothetical protein J437_LFUL014418 [Ladona fulva]|uniref:RNA-directed DNA polymerase n=1 Tax=Ladona fulva TaxID=123851 RepID=A0A8K0P0I5_LADFU|nr:hypothetical protein J437_LFUL014418 [Ladona fulva]
MAGHYGAEKTTQKISSQYYWLGMHRQIREYVKECLECQRYKPDNMKSSGLLETPVQNQRFEDNATWWIELFPLMEATAEACAKCILEEVVLQYGTPRRVISDNGPQFASDFPST